MPRSRSARVLLLDGTSSTGKSSAAAALQKNLPRSAVVSADDFPLLDEHNQPYFSGYYGTYIGRQLLRETQRLLLSHDTVIVDTAMGMGSDLLKSQLSVPLQHVVLYASPKSLARNVGKRGDRRLRNVFTNLSDFYEASQKRQGPRVTSLSFGRLLERHAKQEFRSATELQVVVNDILTRLGATGKREVFLQPRMSYDTLIDTTRLSPEQVVDKILQFYDRAS